MRAAGRFEKLLRVYSRAACPECSRPLRGHDDPAPEWDPPAAFHRDVVPLLEGILKRCPEPPDPCPGCQRPAEPDGWNFAIKYATPEELGRLERAFKRYMPAYVYFDKGKWRR
ncbi:hypothetical protein FRUB_05843 [Fimbriiglobus ruber]|uniref:Uncharacterized protein n=2 Tax=Fimbriiglobus ruber TaxID=1908690 RepID=A0A225DG52_9BACT|nr:hypothetical protein FRUB_05843 [Fimbriiglobus ruber]